MHCILPFLFGKHICLQLQYKMYVENLFQLKL